MNRIRALFLGNNRRPVYSQAADIRASIFCKNTNQIASYLRQKGDRYLCAEVFFSLLPTLTDDDYVLTVASMIEKSSLPTAELSKFYINHLSHMITVKDFDGLERSLHLPCRSLPIVLPTFTLMKLVHKCTDFELLIRCLSTLIERNIRNDGDYISWILFSILQQYTAGDENVIEFLLKQTVKRNILYRGNEKTGVTPMMFLLHLCTREKCVPLIDEHLAVIIDPSLLCKVDKWDRSYLTHLLSGQCQHADIDGDGQQLDDEVPLLCPHASFVLSKFFQLLALGNTCQAPVKTILQSEFCLPLRIRLVNEMIKHLNPSSFPIDEYFIYFPSFFVPFYSTHLKRFVHNKNLNQTLIQILNQPEANDYHRLNKVKFLLEQGARVENTKSISCTVQQLLFHTSSTIPFLLLDYSFYIEIPESLPSIRKLGIVDLYIRRLAQCGYRKGFEANFESIKSQLLPETVEFVRTITQTTPPRLSTICLQRLRCSAVNLGTETREKLTENLPNELRRLLLKLGHDESRVFFRKVILDLE